MEPYFCELNCGVRSNGADLDLLRRLLLKSQANGDPVQFKAGQALFYQEHFPVGCFVVLSGEVELVHESDGKPVVRVPSEPNILGLYHLVHKTTLCATVRALTDVHTLFFARPYVMNLFNT